MMGWRKGWAQRALGQWRGGLQRRGSAKTEAGIFTYGEDFDLPRDPLAEARDEAVDLLNYLHAADAQRAALCAVIAALQQRLIGCAGDADQCCAECEAVHARADAALADVAARNA